jgi:hypothetical protein
MSKSIYTQPERLQMGDRILIRDQECTLKYVDTPDKLGTYDMYVIDSQGHDQHEIVTGLVRLLM